MSVPMELGDSPDRPLLDLLRRRGPLTVAELGAGLNVTATAVRNRLGRLVEAGLVERRAEAAGRGRPRYRYQVSPLAQRRLGQNYTDLALVLWDEMMRSIEDRKLRRQLFARITDRLAEVYKAEIRGEHWERRLLELGTVLHDRGIEAEVVRPDGQSLPILKQHTCPYHELAESDHAICALERKMFEKILGKALRLSHCRLDGHRSCDFEAKPDVTPSPSTRRPARAG